MAEYIDRDIAIAKTTDMFAKIPDNMGLYFVAKCIDALDNIPAANVIEIKHGKWIDLGRNYYTFVNQCSECGAKYDFRSPYCPNCGAKMGGENNV